MSQAIALQISGMSCQHCVRAVREALESVPGVTVDRVDVGSAKVHFDESQADVERITEAVEDAGYSATASAAA